MLRRVYPHIQSITIFDYGLPHKGICGGAEVPQQSPQETFCCCATGSAWEFLVRQQCVGSAGKDGCFSLDVAGAVTVATFVYLKFGPI